MAGLLVGTSSDFCQVCVGSRVMLVLSLESSTPLRNKCLKFYMFCASTEHDII